MADPPGQRLTPLRQAAAGVLADGCVVQPSRPCQLGSARLLGCCTSFRSGLHGRGGAVGAFAGLVGAPVSPPALGPVVASGVVFCSQPAGDGVEPDWCERQPAHSPGGSGHDQLLVAAGESPHSLVAVLAGVGFGHPHQRACGGGAVCDHLGAFCFSPTPRCLAARTAAAVPRNAAHLGGGCPLVWGSRPARRPTLFAKLFRLSQPSALHRGGESPPVALVVLRRTVAGGQLALVASAVAWVVACFGCIALEPGPLRRLLAPGGVAALQPVGHEATQLLAAGHTGGRHLGGPGLGQGESLYPIGSSPERPIGPGLRGTPGGYSALAAGHWRSRSQCLAAVGGAFGLAARRCVVVARRRSHGPVLEPPGGALFCCGASCCASAQLAVAAPGSVLATAAPGRQPAQPADPCLGVAEPSAATHRASNRHAWGDSPQFSFLCRSPRGV